MPSHRTPANSRIGDSRRGDGGHIVRSPGKGGGPVSIKRRDSDLDLRPPAEPAPRPSSNNVVVGEPRRSPAEDY
jgi:hypothetical protein